MDAVDIGYFSLAACFLLLTVPFLVSHYLKLGMIHDTVVSASRMIVQLAFVGVFLTLLFDLNSSIVNLLWLLVMILAATHSSINDVGLDLKKLLLPIMVSFIAGNFLVILYFNTFVVELENLFDARYLIPIFGMFLGNSLRGNIVSINNFYDTIRRNENRYLYSLSLCAKKHEAILPYARKSLKLALKPSIANMSTIGLVSLPGMMTGQIIAGSSPILAIKYQMAIMIGIYVSTVMTVTIGIFMTIRSSFDDYGILKEDVFKSATA
ncbi:ABC transporter permease [Methanohalophilus sp.]|uniref:ABC transporter permease n=1 Tax=Methanohalophilus sp. TaxID=1966352 RepID=UPI00260483E6|nr:ABC transporter permease [Methanohalophilus sp.]MDK2892339.1 UDP-glucose/iron transport system permease protein [Methanohalophilus sp.]